MKTTIVEIAAGTLVLAACGTDVRGDDVDPSETTPVETGDDDSSGASMDDSSDADSSGSETSDDGGEDSSTGAPTSMCVGWSLDGHASDVHAREGAEVEPGCDARPAACGGDPTGSWTLVESCGYAPADLFECESATEHDYTSTMTGTRTFAADGTLRWELVITETIAVELDPLACFRMDCTAFASSLETPTSTATCESLDDTTCACAIEYTSPLAIEGTWSTNGDTLVLDLGGAIIEQPFCATNDRLALWTPSELPTPTDVPCTTADDCDAALGDDFDHYDCNEPMDNPGG